MRQVKIHEAKTHLSKLLAAVEAGEEIAIARGDKVIARIVREPVVAAPRLLGLLKGRLCTSADFDAPLPDDILDLIEAPLE